MKHIIPDDVLDPDGAATYLGTTPGYLANLRWMGGGPEWTHLPHHRGRVFYAVADLDAYMRGERRA